MNWLPFGGIGETAPRVVSPVGRVKRLSHLDRFIEMMFSNKDLSTEVNHDWQTNARRNERTDQT